MTPSTSTSRASTRRAFSPTLTLQTGAPFSQTALADDVGRVRQAVIDQGNLAPRLDERKVFDSERNLITVTLTGAVGPKVKVEVTGYELSENEAARAAARAPRRDD